MASMVVAMDGGRGSPVLVETALEATIRHGRWMGRKRGAGRSSPSGKMKTRAAQR
jgi:hypothetical protein